MSELYVCRFTGTRNPSSRSGTQVKKTSTMMLFLIFTSKLLNRLTDRSREDTHRASRMVTDLSYMVPIIQPPRLSKMNEDLEMQTRDKYPRTNIVSCSCSCSPVSTSCTRDIHLPPSPSLPFSPYIHIPIHIHIYRYIRSPF